MKINEYLDLSQQLETFTGNENLIQNFLKFEALQLAQTIAKIEGVEIIKFGMTKILDLVKIKEKYQMVIFTGRDHYVINNLNENFWRIEGFAQAEYGFLIVDVIKQLANPNLNEVEVKKLKNKSSCNDYMNELLNMALKTEQSGKFARHDSEQNTLCFANGDQSEQILCLNDGMVIITKANKVKIKTTFEVGFNYVKNHLESGYGLETAA
jgi:hypothetical protein